MFGKIFLYENIQLLLSQHEIKIGELEKHIGVSAGYISRCLNKGEGSKKRLSIEITMKIADFFHVGIEELLFIDLKKDNEKIDLIIRFLEKIIEDTKNEKIIWTMSEEEDETEFMTVTNPRMSFYMNKCLYDYRFYFHDQYDQEIYEHKIFMASDDSSCTLFVKCSHLANEIQKQLDKFIISDLAEDFVKRYLEI